MVYLKVPPNLLVGLRRVETNFDQHKAVSAMSLKPIPSEYEASSSPSIYLTRALLYIYLNLCPVSPKGDIDRLLLDLNHHCVSMMYPQLTETRGAFCQIRVLVFLLHSACVQYEVLKFLWC